MMCDFCGNRISGMSDMTILSVDRFDIPNVIFNVSPYWGACPICAAYLKKDDWAGLLGRAIRHHPRGEHAREPLTKTYEGLRGATNAPLRGARPEDWQVAEDDSLACDHAGRCCKIHNTHSSPHIGCILR